VGHRATRDPTNEDRHQAKLLTIRRIVILSETKCSRRTCLPHAQQARQQETIK
jgi:hypothetical protein